jgi:hypothetical protein
MAVELASGWQNELVGPDKHAVRAPVSRMSVGISSRRMVGGPERATSRENRISQPSRPGTRLRSIRRPSRSWDGRSTAPAHQRSADKTSSSTRAGTPGRCHRSYPARCERRRPPGPERSPAAGPGGRQGGRGRGHGNRRGPSPSRALRIADRADFEQDRPGPPLDRQEGEPPFLHHRHRNR